MADDGDKPLETQRVRSVSQETSERMRPYLPLLLDQALLEREAAGEITYEEVVLAAIAAREQAN